jgi:hypothetical protein
MTTQPIQPKIVSGATVPKLPTVNDDVEVKHDIEGERSDVTAPFANRAQAFSASRLTSEPLDLNQVDSLRQESVDGCDFLTSAEIKTWCELAGHEQRYLEEALNKLEPDKQIEIAKDFREIQQISSKEIIERAVVAYGKEVCKIAQNLGVSEQGLKEVLGGFRISENERMIAHFSLEEKRYCFVLNPNQIKSDSLNSKLKFLSNPTQKHVPIFFGDWKDKIIDAVSHESKHIEQNLVQLLLSPMDYFLAYNRSLKHAIKSKSFFGRAKERLVHNAIVYLGYFSKTGEGIRALKPKLTKEERENGLNEVEYHLKAVRANDANRTEIFGESKYLNCRHEVDARMHSILTRLEDISEQVNSPLMHPETSKQRFDAVKKELEKESEDFLQPKHEDLAVRLRNIGDLITSSEAKLGL